MSDHFDRLGQQRRITEFTNRVHQVAESAKTGRPIGPLEPISSIHTVAAILREAAGRLRGDEESLERLLDYILRLGQRTRDEVLRGASTALFLPMLRRDIVPPDRKSFGSAMDRIMSNLSSEDGRNPNAIATARLLLSHGQRPDLGTARVVARYLKSPGATPLEGFFSHLLEVDPERRRSYLVAIRDAIGDRTRYSWWLIRRYPDDWPKPVRRDTIRQLWNPPAAMLQTLLSPQLARYITRAV